MKKEMFLSELREILRDTGEQKAYSDNRLEFALLIAINQVNANFSVNKKVYSTQENTLITDAQLISIIESNANFEIGGDQQYIKFTGYEKPYKVKIVECISSLDYELPDIYNELIIMTAVRYLMSTEYNEQNMERVSIYNNLIKSTEKRLFDYQTHLNNHAQ